jgi:hypothetical protein
MTKNDILNALKYVGVFAAGAAVGAVVSEYITRKKMEKLNEKDLEDLKKHYEDEKINSYFPNPAATGKEVEVPNHVDVVTMPETEENGEAAIFVPGAAPTIDSTKQGGELNTHSTAYSNYFPTSDPTLTGEKKFFDEDAKPYHIDEDDFGTKDLYSTITVMLYVDADKTTNPNDPVYIPCDEETDQPIENVENTIGDYTKYVSVYADPIYMRNDRLRIDYEILPTNIPYSAANGVDRSMPDDETYGD